MDAPLLATKLFVPRPRPGVVGRPRLADRLNTALSYNLVLVSAPAGFGKTTLVSEWARENEGRVRAAWISLDEGDNDPVRFWDYFVAALRTLKPAVGETASAMLHSPQAYPVESMLTALINDTTAISEDFAVVLDDYHLIKAETIHTGVMFLLDHISPRMHLIIATRVDPALPLPRLRGRGTMLEIGADDLRFTLEEATALLQRLQPPGLSADDVDILYERTEGWAAGLKMAALSVRGQKDIRNLVATLSGSQRYIMDYLMEEVLKKQTERVRGFLLETSLLERLSVPLCDYVTGQGGSEDVLIELESALGGFLVPQDEVRQWYRYHHLFADLLGHQCEMVYGSEHVASLHRQASQWYEDNDLPDEAIRHAMAGRDWERAMRLTSAHYEERGKRGEFKTLLAWLQAIPDEVLRENLALYSRYAYVLSQMGPLEEAEAVVSYLESAVQDGSSLQGELVLSRAFVYQRRGDTKRYLELCEKAFGLLPPDDVVLRGSAAGRMAHAQHRLGLIKEAEEWATKACELGQLAGDTHRVIANLETLGIVATYRSKLRRAVDIYKKAIELGGQTALADRPRVMLCMVQYYLNDLEGAAESARLGVKYCDFSGGMSNAIAGHYYQAQVCLARGDAAGAAAAMDKMEQAGLNPTVDSHWYANYIACRVMYAIRQGNLDEAARWGERLPDIEGMIMIDRHVPARLLLAQGKKEEAAKLFQELHHSSIEHGALLLVIPIRIYQAMAADSEASALEFLAEALTKAEPEGAIRHFVDEGTLLRPLLEKALVRGITPGFTRKLLDIIDEEERQRGLSRGPESPVPHSPELVSRRELEVLRLVADGLSNQQIAERLTVSLSTAKTHVHRLFEKLNARDRLQVVTRARELKLI